MNRIYLLSIFLLFFMVSLAMSQIPRQMNYQGYLTDNNNNPITGNLIIRFTIYDAPTTGTNLWNEEHPTVALIDGVFRVVLGSINPLNIAFDKPYWLGIRVGNDPEMTPRTTLTSAGYSLNSLKAESVKDSSVTTASIQNGAVTLPKLQPDMMVKVFEGTCNNVSSYLITGLDGNLHKMYKIYFQGTIHTGETMLLLRPNEDDVQNHFRSYVLYHGNASLSATWSTVGIGCVRSWAVANNASFEVTLFAETGRLRYVVGQALIARPTGEILGQQPYGYWTNSGDIIDRIKFSLTNFSGIAIGTFSGTFTIYAVNPR
ncbi:MAG: hypothetical protein GQ561_02400 [Calditrichae bacterium]|nr:hypothetical protein [Calditrichia bacterium]